MANSDPWQLANPAKLFLERYHHAVVHIVRFNHDGTEESGTGFHVGEGFIVTAAHVIDGAKAFRVFARHHQRGKFGDPDANEVIVHEVTRAAKQTTDVAVLKTDFRAFSYGPKTTVMANDWMVIPLSSIPIGLHYDDFLGEIDFLLTRVFVFGYPPIARSRAPTLVAMSGDVNAIVDRYDADFVHFVISPAPKGGFSGAPVISEYDYALGMITDDFVRKTAEGIVEAATAIVSIEPIVQVLAEAGFDAEAV